MVSHSARSIPATWASKLPGSAMIRSSRFRIWVRLQWTVPARISSLEEKYSYSVPLPRPAASAICCTRRLAMSTPCRARASTPVNTWICLSV